MLDNKYATRRHSLDVKQVVSEVLDVCQVEVLDPLKDRIESDGGGKSVLDSRLQQELAAATSEVLDGVEVDDYRLELINTLLRVSHSPRPVPGLAVDNLFGGPAAGLDYDSRVDVWVVGRYAIGGARAACLPQSSVVLSTGVDVSSAILSDISCAAKGQVNEVIL